MEVHLKAWREHRMLTQRELAEAADVNQGTIVRIEKGTMPPRFGTLRKLAKALDVEPQALRREPRDTDAAAAA